MSPSPIPEPPATQNKARSRPPKTSSGSGNTRPTTPTSKAAKTTSSRTSVSAPSSSNTSPRPNPSGEPPSTAVRAHSPPPRSTTSPFPARSSPTRTATSPSRAASSTSAPRAACSGSISVAKRPRQRTAPRRLRRHRLDQGRPPHNRSRSRIHALALPRRGLRPDTPPAALTRALARWAAEPLPGSGIVQNITHAIIVDPDGTPHEVTPASLGISRPRPTAPNTEAAPALKPRN